MLLLEPPTDCPSCSLAFCSAYLWPIIRLLPKKAQTLASTADIASLSPPRLTLFHRDPIFHTIARRQTQAL